MWVTKPRRFFGSVKATVEFLTFIAAVFVLGVMVWHSFIMKDSLKVSEQALLQMDSTFTLTTTQIGLQEKEYDVLKQELDLMKSSLNVQSKQYEDLRIVYEEQNRPRMQIGPQTVSIKDSGLVIIYTTVENIGDSDAENVLVYKTYKFPGITGKDTSSFIFRLDKFTIRSEKILSDRIVFIGASYNQDFYSLVDVRYSWPKYKENYEDHKYYIQRYDKDSMTFTAYQLDDDEGKMLFK